MMALGRLCALALAIVASGCGFARADDHYPSRVITIVVPLTPGTAMDIQARLFADGLSKRFGYQAIVVNRPGAGTLIGAETVANAAPDGYTVLLTNSAHAILGAMNKNLPFDPVADFAGICMVGQAPTIVTVAPSLGVHNLQEFVALAKAKPGTINYGSAGIGTATHIAGAYFAYKTGTELVHVPYTVSQTHSHRHAQRQYPGDLCAGSLHVADAAGRAAVGACGRRRRAGDASRSKFRPRAPPASITSIRPGTAFWRRPKRRATCCEELHDAIVDVGKDPGHPGQDPRARYYAGQHRASRFRRPYPRRHGAAGADLWRSSARRNSAAYYGRR